MTLKQTQQLLNMLRECGVERYKTEQVEIHFSTGTHTTTHIYPNQAKALKEDDINQAMPLKAPPASAVPPAELSIPHHVNEVASLLKLSDNDLVNKLFPERP